MSIDLFVARTQMAVNVSPSDREALRTLKLTKRVLSNRELLCKEGDVVSQCTIIHSGLLARYKIIEDREQILSIHVPGDFPDLQTLQLPTLDHNIISIGPAEVGQVSHHHLQAVLDASPSLAHMFWRETLREAAIYREWVCNVAARDALGSIAHLICEIFIRLDTVGLVQDNRLEFPLTQQDLANATGLSPVHANRTIQHLRGLDLIRWEGRSLTIKDLVALQSLADFDQDYLHLDFS